MAIKVNINPLEAATALPYLGRKIMYNNSEWAALYRNMHKSQRRWWVVEKFIGKTIATIKLHSMMYKVLVQAVSLYGG